MDSRIVLLENEFAQMWYYPEDRIIHHEILQPVAGEAFHNLLMTGLQALNEHNVQKWLSDDRNHSFLNAEDSAWSQEYWLPLAVKSGWRYWAMVPPKHSRGQINIKRLIEYVAEKYRLNAKLFNNPDEALQWLMEQDNDIIP
jgi:hypothetical protein